MDSEKNVPSIFSNPYDYYLSKHDWLSHRFGWSEQHLTERFLDLQGFLASISETLEDEKLDYKKSTFPLGFYEVEQPTRIRYAWLIFLFTIYERRIRALCDLIREVDPAPGPTLDDLRGTLSDRLKEFLRTRIEYNVGNNAAWSEVQSLQKVRDCIIHCGGRVTESRDEEFLRNLTSRDEGVEISPWEYLRVEEGFCVRMEGAVGDLLFPLLDDAHQVLRARIIAHQQLEQGTSTDDDG